MKGAVALQDGRVFEGESFGAEGKHAGEVVFNTSMTGYQEILTDPSYKGQIVIMTYPLIGNYGVNAEDVESEAPQVEGFIVREYCPFPSNNAAQGTLGDYLREHGVVALSEIDTRALTRHIRTRGAMEGVIAAGNYDVHELVAEAKSATDLNFRDMVERVTCSESYVYEPSPDAPPDAPFIVAIDYGIKKNILRCLAQMGCRILVMPADTTAEEVLAHDPDGVLLSNGPGDPRGVPYAIETVRNLLGKKPLFGICLGHEFMGLALGGEIKKLKFGHRGSNHPIKDLNTGEIDITCQNHGYHVDLDSLSSREEVEVTHINLNDHTAAGIRHKRIPAASVQYHPEASAGPHDARHLFRTFMQMVEQERERKRHA